MGNTHTIDDKIHDDIEFMKYLDACTNNLLNSATNDRQNFKDNISEYYKEGWSQRVLGSGLHKDYKQSDEFSLDGIVKIIKDIVNGFFGVGQETPEGIKKNVEATKIMHGMLSAEVIILQVVLTVVINLLAVFATKTDLTYQSTEAHEMVAAGLTLHLFVMDASYTSQTYFSGKSIEEDIFEFELIWSPEQEKEMGKKKVMDGYVKNLGAAIASLGKVQANFDKEAEKDDPDLARLKKLSDTIDIMNGNIVKLKWLLNGVTIHNTMLI